jgi:transposase
MKTVELYARVWRAVLVDGMSRRAAAREFGLARKTVSKMLEYPLPPGYQRQKPVRRPKLGPWQGVIDAILEDDKQRPRKQRHTAKRVFERLRAEHGRRMLMQSSHYAHARQMKRARACTRKLKTQLGRIVREIELQVETPSNKLRKLLQTAHRIHAQQRHDKNKIYSVHEPEVKCIAIGNAGKQYEFGNKVSVAVSSRGGWFVGAKSFTGNPYDGHTLAEQMKQVENLI